jgi:putative hemolysin
MDKTEKSYVGLHAQLIKKLLATHKNREISDNDLFVAICNHADLIIEVTEQEVC